MAMNTIDAGLEMSEVAAAGPALRVGVEMGGTFTDLVAIKGDDVRLLKVPSNPSEPYRAVVDALQASGLNLSEVRSLVHGSTLATNTILERKGAKTAFITTEGFRDILEIQRHDRTDIHALDYQKPMPIIARQHCFGAIERIDGAGQVVTPICREHVLSSLVPMLRAGGYASVAICLLNAHENDTHEQELSDLLSEHLPDLLVTRSATINREFREYERASTTAMSAYVQPVINEYLARLETSLKSVGYDRQLSIMQSNGGRIPAEAMRRTCISAFLSGPAGGVIGAIRQAERSGVTNILTFDMGGTSSDVALVMDGEAKIAEQSEVHGLPIRFPMIDITTIGAGGGSIVSVDAGGMLHVGPESAGARPGPACYGRGGALPTLTDANVICGILQPETFLGGLMKLDVDAARAAFEPIAAQLGTTVEEAADGALSLAGANVMRAMQTVSTERGKDPREFTLVPFGGAGPLNACDLAEEIGVASVLVPPNPGVLSAFGLLACDTRTISVRSCYGQLTAALMDTLRSTLVEMEGDSATELAGYGFTTSHTLGVVLSMRYAGQAFEIQVPVAYGDLAAMTPATLARMFAAEYQKVFFSDTLADLAVEVVAIRLVAIQPNLDPPRLKWATDSDLSERVVPVRRRGKVHDCTIVPVGNLKLGEPRKGPVLVTSMTSSFFVQTGWSATIDIADNVIIERHK